MDFRHWPVHEIYLSRQGFDSGSAVSLFRLCSVFVCRDHTWRHHGVAEEFDPLMVLASVQREKCTAIYGVPTMFIAELNHPMFDMFDLTSLRTGIMAGRSVPDRNHEPGDDKNACQRYYYSIWPY